MEPTTRIELVTSSLPRKCSTPELRGPKLKHAALTSVHPHAADMERVMGIEPTSSAWKAEVLPLNYTRFSRTESASQQRNLKTLPNAPKLDRTSTRSCKLRPSIAQKPTRHTQTRKGREACPDTKSRLPALSKFSAERD